MNNAFRYLVLSKELRSTVNPLEDQQVEEVHATEDEKDKADLIRKCFDRNPCSLYIDSQLEREGYVPEVDEIETND